MTKKKERKKKERKKERKKKERKKKRKKEAVPLYLEIIDEVYTMTVTCDEIAAAEFYFFKLAIIISHFVAYSFNTFNVHVKHT